MTPEIIGYVCIGILGAFLLFGMFWGMVRGFKKSLFRGIWLVLLALIMFFLTPTISNALCNMNLDFLNLNIGGEPVHTVYQTLYSFLMKQEDVADIVTNNPSIIPLIQQLIVLVLNTFMFPLLFWVAKIITYPIWAIISAIVFKKKKAMVDGKKKVIKTKKYRFVGLLVGAVAGMMVMTITLMPVNGTLKLMKEVDAIEYSASEDGEGLITSMIGADNMKYVEAYNDSILSKTMKYTGISTISNSMYTFLSTKKIDDQKVVLGDEVKLYVTLYNDIEVISKTDFNTIDKAGMSIFLNSSENLLRNIFSSKVLRIVGDDLIVYAFDKLEENGTIDKYLDKINIEEIKELALESVDEIKTSSVSTLQQDLLNVVYICKSLNDNDILIPTLKQELKAEDYLTLVTDNVIDEVSNYMFNMPSVRKIYPVAINKGLSYVGNLLGFEYVEKEFNDNNLTQTDFANILKGGLNVVRTLDFDSTYKITKSSLEAVGQFLDIAKELYVLEDGVFDNIVSKLFDKGTDYINELELTQDLKTLINTVVNKVETMVLNKETLLKNEFRQYGILFDEVKVVVEEFQTSKKTELTLKTYGAILDKLNKTDLFEDIVADLIDAGWDMVKDKVSELAPEFTDITTIIETVKNNIVLVLRNQQVTNPEISSSSNIQLSLETEFDNLQDLYDFFIINFQPYFKDGGTGVTGITEDLFSDENTLLTNFGSELDKLTDCEHLIITNDVIRKVIVQALTIVKDEMITESTAQQFLGDIITNVSTYTLNVTWAEELSYFKRLASAAENGIELDTIGAVLDSVCGSRYIGNTIINNLLNEQIQTKYDEINDSIKNDTTDLIIQKIKENISTINTGVYAKEIAYLLDMMDLIENSTSKTFDELGTSLDEFGLSVTISNVRPLMITYALNKELENATDSTMITVLETIIENAKNIPTTVVNNFYETELSGLETVTNISYPTSKDDLTETVLTEMGTAFYNVSGTILSYNLGEVVMGIIFDYVEYDDIADVLASIEENITSTNGILVNNRLNTSKPAADQLVNKTNYIACFTDLYDLVNIYEEINTLTIDGNLDGSVIGGYLDSIEKLTIIDGEDKTFAKMVVEDLQTNGNNEIASKKADKIAEIEASNASEMDKMAAKAIVEDAVSDATTQFETIIDNANTSITNKTQTYVEIFSTLVEEINDLVEELDTQLEY